MKTETKFIAGIIAATLAIIIGAVFFLSKTSTPQISKGEKVDEKILIGDNSQKISSSSASVTLVEFADFQCPACGAYHPIVKQLLSEFKGKINFVHRDFPLPMHKNAFVAAQSAGAAGKQGKFWEMHDKLFETQNEWSEANAKEKFMEYAKTIKMDADKFKKDLESEEIKNKIEQDIKDGYSLGVNSTPTFFVNQEKLLKNPSTYEDFKTIIKAAILKAPIVQTSEDKYHIHADFKVYVNGKAMDFTQSKYQSTEEKELNEYIHLHDGNGDIIHVHKKGIRLGEFFDSLGIKFSSECLVLDTGESYCGSEDQLLKFYVNGKENNLYDKYEPQDLDRILIVYGKQELHSNGKDYVTDKACIYSLKCPERGKPPTENCVGGLGTDCGD